MSKTLHPDDFANKSSEDLQILADLEAEWRVFIANSSIGHCPIASSEKLSKKESVVQFDLDGNPIDITGWLDATYFDIARACGAVNFWQGFKGRSRGESLSGMDAHLNWTYPTSGGSAADGILRLLKPFELEDGTKVENVLVDCKAQLCRSEPFAKKSDLHLSLGRNALAVMEIIERGIPYICTLVHRCEETDSLMGYRVNLTHEYQRAKQGRPRTAKWYSRLADMKFNSFSNMGFTVKETKRAVSSSSDTRGRDTDDLFTVSWTDDRSYPVARIRLGHIAGGRSQGKLKRQNSRDDDLYCWYPMEDLAEMPIDMWVHR